jgi:hypothetical protein
VSNVPRPGLVLHGVPHPNDGPIPGKGPPHKYNREVHESIVDMIRNGATPEHAAAFNRISQTTFYEWIRRGRSEDPYLIEFSEDVEQALAEAKMKLERIVMDGSVKDPQLALKALERKDPSNWSKTVKLETRNEINGFLDDLLSRADNNPNYRFTLTEILQIASRRASAGSLGSGADED